MKNTIDRIFKIICQMVNLIAPALLFIKYKKKTEPKNAEEILASLIRFHREEIEKQELKIEKEVVKFKRLSRRMILIDKIISNLNEYKTPALITGGLLKKITETIASSQTKDESSENSIIGMMLIEKARLISRSYTIYGITLLLSITANATANYDSHLISFISTAGFILTFINQKSIEYRIKKGLYGDNRYEATEIARYIDEKFNHNDFSDGSGGVKRMAPLKIEESFKDGTVDSPSIIKI